MHRFILIRSSKFPVLDCEKAEIINPGTYGKAFAKYIQANLVAIGYVCPLVCIEDWGWWVDLKLEQTTIGICCYREHDENTECHFVCAPSPEQDKIWSWKKLRRINIKVELDKLVDDLIKIFKNDAEIEFVSLSGQFPF